MSQSSDGECLKGAVTLLSHMQCILKFGTYVSGVKACLVNGVICVKPNHDGIPCRVDFFQRLQKRKTKKERENIDRSSLHAK